MSAPDGGAERGRPLRVVVADDQTAVRDGLVMLLGLVPGLEVVGSAADGAAAVEADERLHPDAVLMDLRMPGLDGVGATRLLAERHPDVAVVVLTTYADDDSVLDALRAGARGYLTKDAGRADIARALHAAAARQVVLDPAVQARLLAAAVAGREQPAPPAGRAPEGLSPREAEVLELMAGGLSNTEIGERLFIGAATVKTHVNRVFAKLGVTTRAQAIALAHRGPGRAGTPRSSDDPAAPPH